VVKKLAKIAEILGHRGFILQYILWYFLL